MNTKIDKEIQNESEHIKMLAAENRALREAASYTLRNLDAAAEQRLITCPANFQVQLSESRKLLRAALGNTVTEPDQVKAKLLAAVQVLTLTPAIKAFLVEHDPKALEQANAAIAAATNML